MGKNYKWQSFQKVSVSKNFGIPFAKAKAVRRNEAGHDDEGVISHDNEVFLSQTEVLNEVDHCRRIYNKDDRFTIERN